MTNMEVKTEKAGTFVLTDSQATELLRRTLEIVFDNLSKEKKPVPQTWEELKAYFMSCFDTTEGH